MSQEVLLATALEAHFRAAPTPAILPFAALLDELGLSTNVALRLLSAGRLPRFALLAETDEVGGLRAALRGGLRARLRAWLRPPPLAEARIAFLPALRCAFARLCAEASTAGAARVLFTADELPNSAERALFLELLCREGKIARHALPGGAVYSRGGARGLALRRALLERAAAEALRAARESPAKAEIADCVVVLEDVCAVEAATESELEGVASVLGYLQERLERFGVEICVE